MYKSIIRIPVIVETQKQKILNREYETQLKIINRKIKIENILSNLK
jgi:glutathionyl-hydroquinone reductase